jgi:hypothetical protein
MMRLILYFIALNTFCSAAYFYDIRIFKVENCTSSDESLFTFEKCVASKVTGLNTTLSIKKKVKFISVRIKFSFILEFFDFVFKYEHHSSHKQNGTFVEFMTKKEENLNWCGYLKGRKGDRVLLYFIKLVFPQLFGKCPTEGRYELVNANVGKCFFSDLPLGVIRYTLKLTDFETKAFIFFSMLVEVTDV